MQINWNLAVLQKSNTRRDIWGRVGLDALSNYKASCLDHVLESKEAQL
jgi:hypothetical protein